MRSQGIYGRIKMKSKGTSILKRRVRTAICFGVVFSLLASFAPYPQPAYADSNLPYLDPNLPIDERVEDLIARMTIEEKAAQLMAVWLTKPNDNSKVPKDQRPLGGEFSPEKAKEVIPRLKDTYDLVFIDAAKKEYLHYFELLRNTSLITGKQ